MQQLMIYGASGYTGRMAAERALAAGLPLVLGGRSHASLVQLGESLGAACRVFDLLDPGAIDEALADVSAVLNCAGPYTRKEATRAAAALVKCGRLTSPRQQAASDSGWVGRPT